MPRETRTSSAETSRRTASLPRGESLNGATHQGISIIPGARLAPGEVPTGIGETVALHPIKSPDDLIKGASKRIDLEGGKAVTEYILGELDTTRVLRRVPAEGFDSAVAIADALDMRASAKARLEGEAEKIAEVIDSTDGVLLEGAAFYPEAVEKIEKLTGILEAQQSGINPEKDKVLYERVAGNVSILQKAKADVEDLPVTVPGFADAVRSAHPDVDIDLPQKEEPVAQPVEDPATEVKSPAKYGKLSDEEITPDVITDISKTAGLTETSVNKLLDSGVKVGDIEDLVALRRPYGDIPGDPHIPQITLKHLSEMYNLTDGNLTLVANIIGFAKDEIRSRDTEVQRRSINPVLKDILQDLTTITEQGYSLEFAMDNISTRYNEPKDEDEPRDPLQDKAWR